MKSSEERKTENLVGCLLMLLILPFLVALRGWVIATLWRWLIVPTFDGARVLSIWQALGLSIIVGVLTMKKPEPDEKSTLESTLEMTGYVIAAYALSIGLAWIVSHQL